MPWRACTAIQDRIPSTAGPWPKKRRKDPAWPLTAITGRGFQIALSKSFIGETLPCMYFISSFKRQNERGRGGFSYETSRRNNLESPPRDWPSIACRHGFAEPSLLFLGRRKQKCWPPTLILWCSGSDVEWRWLTSVPLLQF